jgi:hypothetical protein
MRVRFFDQPYLLFDGDEPSIQDKNGHLEGPVFSRRQVGLGEWHDGELL